MPNIDTLDTATSALATAIKLVRLLVQDGLTKDQLQVAIGTRTKRTNLSEYIARGCPKLPTAESKTAEPAAPIENERFRVIDENTIEVNLGASPKLPFDGATIDTNSAAADKWVTICKHGNYLFQDSVKIILHTDDGQKNGRSIQGHNLRTNLANKTSVHPNVFDALFECNMMPEGFKIDEKGNTRFIFSFAVVYRDRDGYLCVRYWYWYEGRWQSYYDWLGSDWYGSSPSALLAS